MNFLQHSIVFHEWLMAKSSPKELEVEKKYMYDLFQLKTTLNACVQRLRDVVTQINTLTFCLSLKSLRAGTEENLQICQHQREATRQNYSLIANMLIFSPQNASIITKFEKLFHCKRFSQCLNFKLSNSILIWQVLMHARLNEGALST